MPPQLALAGGFMVAPPYGTMHPFDFVVQGGQNLWRVQVKASIHLRKGLYAVNIYRSQGRRLRPYTASEVDFVAVYIVPDDAWFIVPVREVDRRMLLFRPKISWRRAATSTPATVKPGTS